MTEADVERIATQVYQKYGTRFGNPQVPVHYHNNIDSPFLPQFQAVNTGNNGVFSSKNLAGQVLNINQTTGQGQSNVYSVPIPIIYGNGVGSASEFNGGDANNGSLVIFNNGAINQLWWRVQDQWWGVGGAGAGAASLFGPL